MAKQRLAYLELLRYLADGDAGALDSVDCLGAIQVMEIRPLHLQVGEGGRRFDQSIIG
jgi:hypothetical protein